MTVVLGLLAALSYGLSDFVGGVASRRRNAVTVLLFAYPIGVIASALALVFLPGTLSWATAGWGVAGGTAGLLGVVALYQALSTGPISVVSPVSAVLSAAIPVVVGVVVGERPGVLSWVGVVVGLAAVVLVGASSGGSGRVPPRALLLALAAGIGIGLYFVALARADGGSGVWPLLISRITAAVLIVPVAWGSRTLQPLGGRTLVLALAAGLFDALANLAFLLAARSGYLSLASVLTALYPAVTVALAASLLHERPGTVQRFGLLAAVAAVVLITV